MASGAPADLERDEPGDLRQVAASARLTSAAPECAAETGSTPAAAASAATIPNASGKVLGKTRASPAGTSSATSSCSSRPANATLAASGERETRRAVREPVEEGSEQRRGASSPPSTPALPPRARARLRSPRRDRPGGAEPLEARSRRSATGRPGSRVDQRPRASSRSTPFVRSACRRRRRAGPGGGEPLDRLCSASRWSDAQDAIAGGPLEARAASGAALPRLGLPGRRARCRPPAARGAPWRWLRVVHGLAQALGDVAEPTRIPLAASRPPRA